MYYGNVTFTLSLPRSRTAWIVAAFSTAGAPAAAMHDPLKDCASIGELGKRIDGVLSALSPRPVIIADTSAVFFYPQIAKRFPEARFLVINRQVEAVELSLARAGVDVVPGAMREARHTLEKATSRARYEGRFLRAMSFGSLSDPRMLLHLWQFFGFVGEFPRSYFKDAAGVNIQVPFAEQQARTNIGKAERLFATRHEGW